MTPGSDDFHEQRLELDFAVFARFFAMAVVF